MLYKELVSLFLEVRKEGLKEVYSKGTLDPLIHLLFILEEILLVDEGPPEHWHYGNGR